MLKIPAYYVIDSAEQTTTKFNSSKEVESYINGPSFPESPIKDIKVIHGVEINIKENFKYTLESYQ